MAGSLLPGRGVHFPWGTTGFYGTGPVDTYTADGFGLYNMVGNVWEWSADWFDPCIGLRGR